jgi:GNAT superfamily N-acetyltransferase
MTERSADDGTQQQADVELAWIYAANADLGPDPDEAAELSARQRRLQARAERHALYARDLLHDLGCDAGRIARVAQTCRARHATDVAHGAPGRGYETAAHLADVALEELRRAEAGGGHGGRQRLIAELTEERNRTPSPYRQGFWHMHSWPRRMLRRGNPRWWYRRLRARLTVSMTYGPYDNARFTQVTMLIGGQDIGHVVFQVCSRCKVGYIGKMSVYDPYQGCGIGTQALASLRKKFPGYRWSTSSQYTTARTFWQRTSRAAGGGYEAAADPCEHIKL